MSDMKIEGLGKINGGVFDTVKIEGVCNCSDPIKAVDLFIEGVFDCAGEVEADYLNCTGVANFKAGIRAKKIYVEGVFSQKKWAKIEAQEIRCEGVIKTGGEISADGLYAEGCIEADEIVGDQIKIFSHSKSKFLNIFNRTRSKVRLIEATTIELSGVTANTVNGKDIIIGESCKIDNIDCSGTLFISNSSFVQNITGNYTMKN